MRERSAFGFAGDLYRRNRSRNGALPIFVAVGLVCGAIAWGMSAQDPYWKLYGTATQPAPVYEPAPVEAGTLLSTAPAPGNPDLAAVAPAEAPKDPALAALERAAEVAETPDPALAEIPPLEEEAANPWAAPALASAQALPGLIEPAAFAPDGWSVAGAGAASPALTPFTAPEAPAQPRLVATAETEESLGLSRSGRVDVQRRLALAGFDPRGLDGVFGDNTRAAIADFQTAWGYPSTGYLEPQVHAELNRRTDAAYAAMRARPVVAAMPEARPVEAEQVATTDKRCARRPNGMIIPGQSLGCDMAGFAQHFATMGRSIIGGDDSEAAGGGSVDAELAEGAAAGAPVGLTSTTFASGAGDR